MNTKVTITLIFCLLSTTGIFSQSKSIERRIEYISSKNLAVFFPSFEEDEELEKISAALQKNTKLALNTFWHLNDSITYLAWDGKGSSQNWYKQTKKEHKEDVSFEFASRSIDGLGGFVLSLPKNQAGYFPLAAKIGNDTSLITIIEEFRFVLLDLAKGNIYNQRDLNEKTILIINEVSDNPYYNNYAKGIKERFPNGYIEVQRSFIEKAILNRDTSYLYVNRTNLINVEDGTLIRF